MYRDYYDHFKQSLRLDYKYIIFTLASIAIGGITGVCGAYFAILIKYAAETRAHHPWLIFFMPIGAVVIYYFYNFTTGKKKADTNTVIKASENKGPVPKRMAFQIFFSTIFSHLLGGSVGREGAALQLGGSIGYNTGKLLRVRDENLGIMVMSGMAGAFSALLGVPLTAAILAIEISSVGMIHYKALVPVVFSSITAKYIATLIGAPTVNFGRVSVPDTTITNLLKISLLGIILGMIAFLFIFAISYTNKLYSKIFKKPYIRAFVGGCIVLVLTLLVGSQDYNGSSSDLIGLAISGDTRSYSFILKIVFTALSLAAGFKGGAIVPSFVIGSTAGCVLGNLLGIDPGFAASLGIGAVFCGVTNCPMAALLFCFELFGMDGIPFYLLAISISFVFSYEKSFYSAQEYNIN
ncbi:MAG: chloride channel protein [Lachnospiraceae bacterium]|nr:chloride channel protein [Lachnospiraceae bacterium]